VIDIQINVRNKFSGLLKEINIPQYEDQEMQTQKYGRINQFIHDNIPTSLYRYRTTEDHNIQALKRDYLPVTKPCNMGDIFDSLIAIDSDRVASAIAFELETINIDAMAKSLFDGRAIPKDLLRLLDPHTQAFIQANLPRLKSDISLKPMLEVVFGDIKKYIAQQVQSLENTTVNTLQHIRFIACFCEDVSLVDMWSDYAGKHTGFALEYNFKEQELLCLKKHSNCKNIQMKHPLFPVIYNESYDATDYALYIFQNYLMSMKTNNTMHMQFFDWLFYIKGYAYKAERYRREGEWRLLTRMEKSDTYYFDLKPYASIPLSPSAIYFGAKMKNDTFEALNQIAVEIGLKRYRMVDDPLTRTVIPIPILS